MKVGQTLARALTLTLPLTPTLTRYCEAWRGAPAATACGACSLPSDVPSHVLGRGGFDFAVSMRVALDGVFQTSGTLAAFVGDEVRGVATPTAVPFGPLVDDGTVLFQVSVWAAQTEHLTWKFCDGARMVVVEPPCSFTDAEVALPPFRPKCTSGNFGPVYGGPLDVAQYFSGTASHCTIRAPHRAEYGDEDAPVHFISAKTDAAVPHPYP